MWLSVNIYTYTCVTRTKQARQVAPREQQPEELTPRNEPHAAHTNTPTQRQHPRQPQQHSHTNTHNSTHPQTHTSLPPHTHNNTHTPTPTHSLHKSPPSRRNGGPHADAGQDMSLQRRSTAHQSRNHTRADEAASARSDDRQSGRAGGQRRSGLHTCIDSSHGHCCEGTGADLIGINRSSTRDNE